MIECFRYNMVKKDVIQEKLKSKKNIVYHEQSNKTDYVVKIFTDWERFETEKRIGDYLQGSGLQIPKRLSIQEEEQTILYSYIEGTPVADLIETLDYSHEEKIILSIIEWMSKFYSIILDRTGYQYILGDIHLRNFIYVKATGKIYGVDFEECRIGRIETDIARLTVYILHYDPAFTPHKMALASLLWQRLYPILDLDEDYYQQEVKRETEELVLRRNR